MTRYYKDSGIDKVSVTTVTGQLDKPALMIWAVNCACDYILEQLPKITNGNALPDHNEGTVLLMSEVQPLVESARKNFRSVSKTAMDVGSRVHDAIEQYINTGREPFKPSDEVLAGFLAFLEWESKYNVKYLATEQTVYAERYAGTLDLHCTINGKPYVIDFKTTSINENFPAYPEHRYQVAAYRACVGAEGCGVLYLHKQTGQPNWRDTSETYEADLKVFNILVELCYASHPIVNKRFIKQTEKEAA